MLTTSLYSKVRSCLTSSKHIKLECKPQTLASVLSLNSGCFPTVCIATVGDLVHKYFMTCPVCEDTGGWAREGKETQHSFEELGLLEGNNHCGRKTKLKIAMGRSDTVEGYISSTGSCFMTHKVVMNCWRWRLPLAVKKQILFLDRKIFIKRYLQCS